MQALSIQIHPNRSPGLDLQRVTGLLERLAADGDLVERHAVDDGDAGGLYLNHTFGTRRARELWERLRATLLDHPELGESLRRACLVMCSSEAGWDEYVLLHHFDPEVPTDPSALE